MLQIVLVDDETIQLEYMTACCQQFANTYHIPLMISTYTSGESFLFALEDHPEWQLVFLDMQMKNLDGLTVARKIREHNPLLCLVFATAFAEYAVDSYEVSAFDYLLKPIQQEKIDKVILRYLEHQPKKEEIVIISQQKFFVKDIIYVEARQREVLIQTTQQVYLIKESFSRIVSYLPNSYFTQTHRSYYVNLLHINQLLKQDVLLSNAKRVPLSRRLAKKVQLDFIQFYKGEALYDH